MFIIDYINIPFVRKMDAELSQCLKAISIQKPYNTSELTSSDDPYILTTSYGPKAIWKIVQGNLSTFYSEYAQIVHDNTQGNYCICEIPSKTCPFILHGTLRFYLNKNDDFEVFLRHMIHCVQITFKETLSLSANEIELLCIITHSDDMIKIDGEYIWQFCIYFPYCVVDVHYQTTKLRSLVIEKFRANNVFSSLQQQPINDWDTDRVRREEGAILSDIPYGQVPMYLSRDKPNTQALKYQGVYRFIPEDCIEEDADDYDTHIPLNDNTFLPINHSYIQQRIIDSGFLDEFQEMNTEDANKDNEDCIFWLPLILSVHFWKRVSTPKNDESEEELRRMLHTRVDDADQKIAKTMINIISPDRLNKSYFRREIGKSLYSVYYGSDNGLDVWKKMCDPQYHEECEANYPTFAVGNYLTIKTLAWYAKEDSPSEYGAWHYEWCKSSLQNATSGLEADAADAFWHIYWLDFICPSRNRFYCFKNNGWFSSDNGFCISILISREFLNKFEFYRTQLSGLNETLEDPNIKMGNEILIKKVTMLIAKLKKSIFKSNILKELQECFYDENAKQLMDENPAYFRVANGVIECCEKEAVFRPGKPEDFISKFNPIIYPEHFHWGHPTVLKFKLWIKKIFRDTQLVEHFFKDCSSFLYGKNSEKYFRIYSGDAGNNSKSMIIKAIKLALGVYYIDLPNSVFTGVERDGPSPHLAQAKGSRVAVAQEPDDSDEFKGGPIKKFTGGDSFFARNNFSDGESIVASFKIILVCNKVPVIPSGGQAVKNRLLIFPFTSVWSHDAPESEEEQLRTGKFKDDPFFENELPELSKGLLWIMVKTFEKYKREGLKDTPRLVKEYTDKYWAENDVYNLFIEECCEWIYKDKEKQYIDDNIALTNGQIYNDFKLWHKENYPSTKIPVSPTVRIELMKRLGPQKNRKWFGIRLIPKGEKEGIAIL